MFFAQALRRFAEEKEFVFGEKQAAVLAGLFDDLLQHLARRR